MRLLVLGGSGLLGSELLRQSAVGTDVAATYFSRTGTNPGVDWLQVDLRDRAKTLEVVRAVRPDAMINAAFRQDDWATTAFGAAHAAVPAAEVGARLVSVSSDAVFSGHDSPYTEDAVPDPVTPYGAAKAAGETAVQAILPQAVIARTSLIISDTGASEHEHRTAAAVLGQGELFSDDIRCPVHVGDLAAALLELVGSDRIGVHHVAGSDPVSRYELGCLIAARDGLDSERIRRGLRAEHNLPQLDVRLDSTRTQRHLQTRLRGARSFLDQSR